MSIKNIKEEVQNIYDKIITHRRKLHSFPELSFQEYKTSQYIQDVLTELKIPFEIKVDTGVVGYLGEGERCIALRADIDALPIYEETGLEFKSKNEGVMHACGHDMHTAMLLGASEILKKNENKLKGKIKLIFQPGEEKLPGGANLMIKQDVLKNPDVEAVFGQHVNPEVKTGKIAIASGPLMASADELYWTITGKSSHAAQPHISNDPILAASNMILNLQSVLSKYRNPIDPGVLSITSIHGGSATNIIPDKVELKGTLRAFNNEWRYNALKKIENISHHACLIYNVKSEFKPILGYPPLINDIKKVWDVEHICEKLFGIRSIEKFEPKMWAEDFAYYCNEVPSVFWFLGVNPNTNSEMHSLHNSKFSPDENALIIGTSLMSAIGLNYFK